MVHPAASTGSGAHRTLGDAEHQAFEDGYVPVNRAFADAGADEVDAAGGSALVMLHDYHFYLVADQVRARCPDALISQFIHIPWPGPDAWRVLPPTMRDAWCVACWDATLSPFTLRNRPAASC